MGKLKKPFKETKLGNIVDKAKDFLPGAATIALKAATNPVGAVKDVVNLLTGVEDPIAKECLSKLRLKELEIVAELKNTELTEITKRWTSDMLSDSWLAKNVRPLALIFLLVTVTIMAIWDSATQDKIIEGVVMVSDSFKVDEKWVRLYKDLLWIVFLAYFGGRSVEKIMKK